MITICTSLKRALSVADRLFDLKSRNRASLTLECYQNGREQGLQLFGLDKQGNMRTICWSEHRSTDYIVVYCGEHAMQGLSDDAYRNMRLEATEQAAAAYILSLIYKHFV